MLFLGGLFPIRVILLAFVPASSGERAHFAEQLGGSECTFADLVSSELAELSSDSAVLPSSRSAAEFLPGLSQLVTLFRRVGLGAGGECAISGLSCRRFARSFACLYFPLIFKMFCLAAPPLQ